MGEFCQALLEDVQGQVGSETTQIHQDGIFWLSQGCKSSGSPSTSASGKAAHVGGLHSFIPARAGKPGGSLTLS